MCTTGNYNVGLCKEVGNQPLIPLKLPKIGSWEKKTFPSLDLHISNNILQIREGKVSKFKFMHTLSKKVFLQLNKRLLFHAL